MIFVFVAKNFEFLGKLERIFPIVNKIYEPKIRQRFQNFFSHFAKSGASTPWKPSNKASAVVAQVPKNFWFVIDFVDAADITAVVNFDLPVGSRISFGRFFRIEPIAFRFDSWREASTRIHVRRTLK